MPWLIRRPLAPAICGVATFGHYRRVPVGVAGTYGRSLHSDHHGEWTYDLTWKPVQSFPVRFGWLRAIRNAHVRVRRGLQIGVPILVTCSDASFKLPAWHESAHDMDAVLDVEHIARWAPNLGTQVALIRIPGGKHDLTLSRPPARAQLFTELDRWLAAHLPPTVTKTARGYGHSSQPPRHTSRSRLSSPRPPA
jgi:alpha-beta hydrolase superfamily lysophospholipase